MPWKEWLILQPLNNPFWPLYVNYVLGTFGKGCFRTVQGQIGVGDGI
jgi:hypothetical protein